MKKTVLLLSSFAFSISSFSAHALEIVTSIAPVHSLVSNVMQGVGKPELIIKGAQSPHSYQLKPSDARKLQKADGVFWVGPDLETFLQGPIKSLSTKAMVVSLGEDDPEMHEPNEHHADHHGDHEDMHIWLDPIQTVAMVHAIEGALIKLDPAHKKTYQENAEKLEERLEKLNHEISESLKPVHDKPFIVFHDAYSAFEKRYDLNIAGSISISPQRIPGAKRLKDIRKTITSIGATCVFAEPQFKPKLVHSVVEGTQAKTGILDPLGTSHKNGPDQYFDLMRDMASALTKCLK
ncbi:High-affinity zinc uptake system protein ZnuA [Candidatus Terasakiella magnetica]|uniref:High-affinity zinc uptake system protein ZnuA n=1 Tax=Candidatus Terasakiella magnetica TaxID=1867952 RepID=A0A1C3RFF7_9PROT|nr:zinc ABC transporter substrate-binding protein [Candidatus Terasakiella magnetica]SCA55985.1 High-affinity zinc uptake system protein ZnuA [Candidatus Terasakiella magnetica]